jgi:hypothetical protein
VQRCVRIVDQEGRELLIDAAFGDPVEIGKKVLARIGRHDERAEGRVIDLDELPNLARAVIDEAKAGVRIARIAAADDDDVAMLLPRHVQQLPMIFILGFLGGCGQPPPRALTMPRDSGRDRLFARLCARILGAKALH